LQQKEDTRGDIIRSHSDRNRGKKRIPEEISSEAIRIGIVVKRQEKKGIYECKRMLSEFHKVQMSAA